MIRTAAHPVAATWPICHAAHTVSLSPLLATGLSLGHRRRGTPFPPRRAGDHLCCNGPASGQKPADDAKGEMVETIEEPIPSQVLDAKRRDI